MPLKLSSIIVFISVLLASCSSLSPLEKETTLAIPTQDTGSTAVNGNDLVVEALIDSASDAGQRDIDKLPNLVEIVAPEEIEPVRPAVTMTANRVVERTINDYLQNRRTLLKLWIERGQIWFPMVETIFAEEGIPDELKYIALGESGLNPLARSSAGAVGMWQFMSATARGEGLRADSWVDERMDPELSTRAAAKHLKVLYESYSGNWHLVLAGYNCSYRCIKRAVERAGGSIENPPSFWEIYPYLPRQTRDFIPKFIAAALIVSDPDLYGIEYESLGQEYSYDIVLINGMLKLESAAELAGVDLATIKKLNPSIRKVTLPDATEPYPLKIPQGTYQRFVSAFSNLPADQKIAPSEYKVQTGDTLAGIARKFETTVEELQTANSIRSHLIYPNQNLMIPGTGANTNISLANLDPLSIYYGESLYRPILLDDDFQLVEQAGSTPEKPLMAVSLSDDYIDDLMVPTIYKVRLGDTLGQIADRFDVSVRDIQTWNNVRGTTIFPNQELTLHTGATVPTEKLYRVQRGDNLASIARRFGVSVDNLKRLNGLNSDLIFPGQDLQLN